MIKKIKELSKIFNEDYFQKLNIYNKDTKKINKKSPMLWLLIICVFAIGYFSFKIINWLDTRGLGDIFLKVYLPIMGVIFTYQTILICTNVFYYSKDLEYILPLPIKPIELLISKFINLITIIYFSELLFLAIPLLFYGLVVQQTLLYFISMILVLILFPIVPAIFISIIMLFVMQLSKLIKNKDIFQIIIVTILTMVMTIGINYILVSTFNDGIIEINSEEITEDNIQDLAKINTEKINTKLEKINNDLIFINPCINMLNNINIFNIFFQLFKLLILEIILFIIFIFFGKKLYLNNLLKNIVLANSKKNKMKNKYKKNKYKKNKIKNSYIKNEFRKIIKNPTFFIQCIFQNLFIIFIFSMLLKLFIPMIIEGFKDEDAISKIGIENFKLQILCMVIGIIQILYTFGNLAISAISREGKNAVVMKYLPVDLYKQFIYKGIPSIIMNIIGSIAIIVTIYLQLDNIPIYYGIIVFIISLIINIINTYFMIIVDLKKPNLDWNSEASALKNNGNKLYQYVVTILIILLLTYFTKIFNNVKIIISIPSIIIVLFMILFFEKIYVKRNINKLFKNIII